MLDYLQIEFFPETIEPRIKTGAFGDSFYDYSEETGDGHADFFLNSQLGIFWKDKLILYNSTKVFSREDPEYIGKEFRNLFAFTEQSYLDFRWNWVQAKFGRDFMQVGPGRSGQLLISDNSRTFDMYQVRLGERLLQFSFWGFFLNRRSIKDPLLLPLSPRANRYLNGHRLSLNIKDKLFIGMSEVIIYGGPNQGWELGYINPFQLYYGYTVNKNGVNANSFYDLDWDLYFIPNLEIYGEILIDDIQVDEKKPGDLEPNEYGFLLGVQWANSGIPGTILNGEYVQVRNRTYNVPTNDWEKYLHRNKVIGYYLGNNFVRYGISSSFWLRPDSRIGLLANYVRQGEGSIAGEFNTDYLNYTVEEGYDEPFPFGIIEKHLQLGGSVFFKPHRLGHITIDVAYNNFDNYGHVEGNEFSEFTFHISLWLQWHKIRNLNWLD